MVSTIRGRALHWGVIAALATGCGDDAVDPDTGAGTEGSATNSTGPGTTDDTGADSGTGTGTGTGSSGDAVDDTTTGGTTDAATDTGTDSGTDTGTETGEESSSSEEGSTDTGMMAEGCYDPAGYPYAGGLCGPLGSPCSILIDEQLDGEHFRNDAPSVTLDDDCEPQVLYSVAEGGFVGHFAQRTGPDTWDDQLTPFEIATGGAVFDPTTGDTLTVTDDGAFGIEAWRWDGAWTMEDAVSPYHLNTHGVGQPADGTVHVALRTDGSDLRHGHLDGTFTFQDIDMQAQSASIAVGPGGAPHLAYWRSNAGWDMWWALAGQAPELVVPAASSVLELSQRAVATVDAGGDGTPHLTFATRTAPDGLHEVVHATRTAPGVWDVTPVASEDPTMNTLCNTIPVMAGQQCMYDYVRVRPLDIVASDGGDVRVLYARDHHQGTLQAVCMPGPGGGFCSWNSFIDNDTSDLHIAWPEAGGGFANAVLVSDTWVRSMTAQIDIDGQLHIAAYVGRGNTAVRYFRIGERT
ncbi:MAG: hypothetical protein AAF799_16895 [Myxococcota bacterium]